MPYPRCVPVGGWGGGALNTSKVTLDLFVCSGKGASNILEYMLCHAFLSVYFLGVLSKKPSDSFVTPHVAFQLAIPTRITDDPRWTRTSQQQKRSLRCAESFCSFATRIIPSVQRRRKPFSELRAGNFVNHVV